MKITSYNVNGIRAALKKGFLEWLQESQTDVLCVQETKATKEQVDTDSFKKIGYPYQYWFSAQKKGYSGVAIFCREEPVNVTFGTGIPSMDAEGRNIRVDYPDCSIMSLYLPSGTNDQRLGFKYDYMDSFHEYIQELKKEIPPLIICGDYNICHQEIDIHNPKMKGVSGFLPEERAWLEKFIDSGFVDSFRWIHPEKPSYTWWSYRANASANNKGWRIDYCMVSSLLTNNITRAYILPEARHSDHCPTCVELQSPLKLQK